MIGAMEVIDIVIIGGGICGLATALVLHRLLSLELYFLVYL